MTLRTFKAKSRKDHIWQKISKHSLSKHVLVHKQICFDWFYQWGQSTQQTCPSRSRLLLLCLNIHQPGACHRQRLPDYITVAGSWVASAGATVERHPSKGFSAVRSVLNESVSGFHWKFILIPVNTLDNKLHVLSVSVNGLSIFWSLAGYSPWGCKSQTRLSHKPSPPPPCFGVGRGNQV